MKNKPRSRSKPSAPRPLKPNAPRIVRKARQKMAVVVTHGDPNEVGGAAISALYGAVYAHKFALKKAGKASFAVGALLGRWPDAHRRGRTRWTGIWGLPIPSSTRSLPQRDMEIEVCVETWDYGGTVAEILHLGPFSEEGPTIQHLHEFIADSGYEIAGGHEEEYLTSPKAKVQKTIIRYPVKRRKRG